MKKIYEQLAICLMIALFLASSCQENPVDPPDPPDPEYPIDIPFSLYYVNCELAGYNWWKCPNNIRNVVLINSKEELESYRECIIHFDILPEVDFSKYSLLLTNSDTWAYQDFINNRSL